MQHNFMRRRDTGPPRGRKTDGAAGPTPAVGMGVWSRVLAKEKPPDFGMLQRTGEVAIRMSVDGRLPREFASLPGLLRVRSQGAEAREGFARSLDRNLGDSGSPNRRMSLSELVALSL